MLSERNARLARCRLEQLDVHAQAEVIDKEATAAIKIMDEVGVNNVKITPDILIAGSNGDSGTMPLLSTFLAQTVAKTLETTKKEQVQATPKN